MIEDALGVMNAWGFTRVGTMIVWVKTSANGTYMIGTGHYVRSNAEYVLVGRRGSGLKPNCIIPGIVETTQMRHSAKPEEVRQWLAAAYPKARKLELFARGDFATSCSWRDICNSFRKEPVRLPTPINQNQEEKEVS